MTDLTNLNKHVRAPSLDFLGMRLPTFASYFSLKNIKKVVSLYHTHMVKIHASHFQLHSLPKKSWKVSPFVFIFSWKSNENYFFLYIFYNKTKYKKIIFFSVFFFSFLATKHKLKVVQSLIWAVFALQCFIKIKLLQLQLGFITFNAWVDSVCSQKSRGKSQKSIQFQRLERQPLDFKIKTLCFLEMNEKKNPRTQG